MSESKKPMGFAAMSPEKRREIAARGGKAVRPETRSFFTNRELASTAGKKGGSSVSKEKRTFSTNRNLAAEAARKGGAKTAARHTKG